MRIKPLFDKVVIKVNDADEKTKSGIVLPSAAQEKQQVATVLAVGEGGIIDGKEVTLQDILKKEEEEKGTSRFEIPSFL